jgi:hypothetical protein
MRRTRRIAGGIQEMDGIEDFNCENLWLGKEERTGRLRALAMPWPL